MNSKEISTIKLSKLREDIDKLTKWAHLEIHEYLQNRVECTHNENGVFIDMRNLSEEHYENLVKMVSFYKENEKDLQKKQKIFSDIKKNLNIVKTK